MADPDPEIIPCPSCGKLIDTSNVGPFTNIACQACGHQMRVKVQFGPYTLLRRHAIGGMSMVLVARDETLDREVIVKILSEKYSNDQRRIAAFEEEARTTASISHPSVVRVFKTGRAFGRFFIAMEFVPGGHFEGQIEQRGKIPERDVLPLALQVAEGLKAAKAAGLIHRDVKPGNILLDASGAATLVDFGLALVTMGGTVKADEIWATPYYVPPETIEGKAEDFRSDIYAFGATFYHALAGVPPCSEESMNTERLREAKRKVKPLRTVAPWVSARTCEIIDRCMGYLPDARYSSYDTLIADLKDALRGGGVEPGRRGRRKGGAWKWLAVAGAAGAIALLLLFVTTRRQNGQAAEASQAVAPLEFDPSAEGEADVLAVSKLYQGAQQLLAEGNFPEARHLYVEVRDHPQVLEPTASWAACEAVAAAWLSGDAVAAGGETALALEHVRQAKGLREEVRSTLTTGLEQLGGWAPREATPPKGDAAVLIAWLTALRHWEQGMPQEATRWFQMVTEAGLTNSAAWLKPHVRWARRYLGDFKTLRGDGPQGFPEEMADAERLASKWDATLAGLQTRGRAQFDVLEWQRQLGAHVTRQLRAHAGAQERPPAEFESRARACDFVGARKALMEWQPQTPGATARRAELIRITQAGDGFLMDVAWHGRSMGYLIKTRDGRAYPSIVRMRRNGVLAKDSAGQEVKLDWGEIEPDSLVRLYWIIFPKDQEGLDGLRRREQAIAFHLLTTDGVEARVEGETLATTSPLFRRRWWRMAAYSL